MAKPKKSATLKRPDKTKTPAKRTRPLNPRRFILHGPGPPKPDSLFISDLRKTITSGAVLFYPACGFLDWGVIKDFSTECKTFLYADWHPTIEQVEQAMLQVPIQNPALNAMRCDWKAAIDIPAQRLVPRPLLRNPKFLKPDERGQYRNNFKQFANKTPWCRWVPTIHAVDGQDRKLKLIYLTVEGVNTYWKLFNRQRAAPQYLCIKNCGYGFGFNYTAFCQWRGPLGRAVFAGWKEHGHAPEFLIAERPNHDWPWTEVVRHVTGATVYRRPKGMTWQKASRALVNGGR
jgi:hypothetical protein